MIKKIEVEVAKETEDVVILLKEVVKTIKMKGDYTVLLPKLITAIDGASDIKEELKNTQAFLNAFTLHAMDFADAFKAEPVKAEEVQA